MNREFGDAPEDHPVTCGLCSQRMPVALIPDHLVQLHGVSPRQIADADVHDRTGEDEAR